MVPLAFFGPLGVPELLVVLLIVMFLFGARRIPEIAKGLGEGIRGFRTSLKGDEGDGNSVAPKDEARENSES